MLTFITFVLIATLAMLAVALLPTHAQSFLRRVRQAPRSRWVRPALACAALLVVALVDARALLAVPVVLGMASITEGQYAGEFILSEANGTLSRDTVTVTVPAGEKYSPGLVLGKITATGKYVGRDESASTGEEEAAGILYSECDNSDGGAPADFTGVIINRFAEVRGEDVDANGGTEATVLSELLTLGIKVRGDLDNVA